MNTFMNNLNAVSNFTLTENGALTHKSTMNMVLDMFAMGAAYRNRTEEDCILLFKNAYEENPELALKCLFYIGDCRGGQGERRFFCTCYNWLAKNDSEVALRNMELIPVYRRWKDVIYSLVDTPIESDMFKFIDKQLKLDMQCETPSLLGKWLPSENTSSKETRALARKTRKALNLDSKSYRQMLSALRQKINVLERLMSAGEWDKIKFDKIPSKAGLIYKNAFARRDIISQKYKEFVEDKNTTVNAKDLYPYEIVNEALKWHITDTDKLVIEKYWNNLPDYFNGDDSSMLVMVDTSGSMCGPHAAAPINVAISLGMYAAERSKGPFKDHYISFSRNPKLVKIEGADFADKVERIYVTNICENTDVAKALELLKHIALLPTTKKEDIPKTLVIVSDLEFDYMTTGRIGSSANAETLLEGIAKEWEKAGLELPHIVFWNVDARQNNIPMLGRSRISYVSGMSPTIFETIITGKSGVELMLEILNSARYEAIH